MRISLSSLFVVALLIVSYVYPPAYVYAAVTTVYLTTGTSWTVPAGWDSANNTIEVIGGGGGGYNSNNTDYGDGGGGGGYSKVSNITLTSGSSVTYSIGSGGAIGTTGGDTYFCNSSSNCTSIAGTAVVVGAKGGVKGSGTGAGGAGGAAASGVGSTKYSGGAGGNGDGGGGGGAAGPFGNGGAGAAGMGGGGGGSGGGAAGVTGGAGGNNRLGAGGGAYGSPGSNGGGGGGNSGSTSVGGAGTEWDSTHGVGGGGGGGIATPTNGAQGGLYGGGGGGGGYSSGSSTSGGVGRQGIIVIQYGTIVVSQPPSAPTISGPAGGDTSTSYTFTFSGSVDPEGDTIRYAIDWDNNGTADAYAPTSGYIVSGSSSSAANDWASAGAKTFKVRAEDVNASVSGWTSHTITLEERSTGVSCVWTERTGAGSHHWGDYGNAVVMSPDGTKLTAVAGDSNDYIYTSTDGGATWTQRTSAGALAWRTVVASDDGLRIIAYEDWYAGIYTSSDRGATWTKRGTYLPYDVSSDGLKVVGYNFYSQTYLQTSTDGGASWTARTAIPGGSLTSSASDGLKLAAIHSTNGYIYTSTDGGANWTQRTSAGALGWNFINYSEDASRIIALTSSNTIYDSTDGGATWTMRPAASVPANWRAIAFSDDGSRILSVDRYTTGSVSVSGDGGGTWLQQSVLGVQMWEDAVVSPDGSKMVAVWGQNSAAPSGYSGSIYTGTCTYNQAPAAPTITDVVVGSTNADQTFSLSGANDPEGNTIRYAIDWDIDGIVDQYAPTGGAYVANNTTQSSTKVGGWSTAGAHTFQVRSEDSQGSHSVWVSHTVTLSSAPTATLSASAATYRSGDPAITLTWSSTNATQCVGTNFNTANLPNSSIGVTPTVTTLYTATCTGPGGSAEATTSVAVTAPYCYVPVGTTPITGYTWSDGIGWIDLNCRNAGVCGTSDFGMAVDADGTIWGCGWSDTVGWVSASADDVNSCPAI